MLAAVLLWLATCAIVGVLVLRQRAATLERAAQSSAALTLVLEEDTARTLQAVDITLAGIANALRLTPAVRNNDPAFQQMLGQRVKALQPYVRALFVIGPDGWLTQDSDYPRTPHVSLADRPYFIAHRENRAVERSMSRPLLSRSGLGWFLAVTRRIDGGGTFNGVAVAAVQPGYFEALYRRMGLAERDAIALYTRDGVLVAQYPGNQDEIGRSSAGSPLFSTHLKRSAQGSYLVDAGVSDSERLVSYRALETEPLVVVVSQSAHVILDAWRGRAMGAAIAMLALLLLLAALVAQFMRQQRLRERAQARAAQAEKLEALGHLTSGISHDFANLLNIVSTNLRVISQQPLDENRTRSAVAVATRALMRGSQLIERLRSFAKRQPLRVRACNLNELVREASELLRQAVTTRATLVTELADNVSPCLLDESECEVALVNLVVNARDAGAARIVLRTYDCAEGTRPPGRKRERSADYVCLAVEDDGHGMTDEERRHALEPFYTTKGEGGTGLGLTQVYGFMQQIGGDVRIDSRLGAGTTVHLLFRKAKRDADRAGDVMPAGKSQSAIGSKEPGFADCE